MTRLSENNIQRTAVHQCTVYLLSTQLMQNTQQIHRKYEQNAIVQHSLALLPLRTITSHFITENSSLEMFQQLQASVFVLHSWMALWKNGISSTTIWENHSQSQWRSRIYRVVWFFHPRSSCTTHLCYSLNVHRYMRCHAWRSRVEEPNNSI